jgi:pyruvate formate lyase activating enzyme
MSLCRYCGRAGKTVSPRLGYCAACIRGHFGAVWPQMEVLHRESRRAFNLPLAPPRDPGGKACTLCFHACRIPEGGHGFCGARRVEDGRIRGGTAAGAGLSYYYDPLPTNCVADWFCPGGTGAGYPKYASCPGPERGFTNLAVFYHACNFNCLYCQNWTFKKATFTGGKVSARELAGVVRKNTACVCYFGGDPTPQLPHALAAARLAMKNAEEAGRRVRICWETNGAMQEEWLQPLAGSSLASGGVIKFDLKAFSEEMHLALCGVSNSQTLKNFATLAARLGERPEVPLLCASTLLVPGYVDLEEIHGLARFISRLNPEIPYSLLGFYPQFYLKDLPTTSQDQALQAQKTAREAGVKNVHLGNAHLLW